MVLVLAVIVLIIRLRRKDQYDVTGKNPFDTLKPLKSSSEETNHEFIYPNPTYQDHEFSVQLTT